MPAEHTVRSPRARSWSSGAAEEGRLQVEQMAGRRGPGDAAPQGCAVGAEAVQAGVASRSTASIVVGAGPIRVHMTCQSARTRAAVYFVSFAIWPSPLARAS